MRFELIPGGDHSPPAKGCPVPIPKVALGMLAAFVLLASTITPVRANTISLAFAGLDPGPGTDTTWKYAASLTGIVGDTSTIVGGPAHAADLAPDPQLGAADPGPFTGDYFEILDIAGLNVAATMALAVPAGWSLVIETITFNYVPPGPAFTDGALFNVRWSRTGGNLVSDAPLGTFKLVSSLITGTGHTYGGNDHKTSDLSPQSNFGTVTAPTLGGPAIISPLPVAALGGIAMFGLVGGSRLRRTRLVSLW